jgi:hypothetical protein
MARIEDVDFATYSSSNCSSGTVQTGAPKFIHAVDYAVTMPKACSAYLSIPFDFFRGDVLSVNVRL